MTSGRKAMDPSQRWATVGFRTGIAAAYSLASHPFNFAKFLIQVGYHPPNVCPDCFGGLFKYNIKRLNCWPVDHVRVRDGVVGLYRGLGLRLTGTILSGLASEGYILPWEYQLEAAQFHAATPSDTERFDYFLKNLIKDLAKLTIRVVISHPFEIFCFRSMAQFVGREELYNNLFRSISSTYSSQGLSGYLTGLVPRWLGEIIGLLISSFLNYAITTYIFYDNRARIVSTLGVNIVSGSFSYPFTVVTSCYAINNCGLSAAGEMPQFNGWTQTWRYLWQEGELDRGSRLTFRK